MKDIVLRSAGEKKPPRRQPLPAPDPVEKPPVLKLVQSVEKTGSWLYGLISPKELTVLEPSRRPVAVRPPAEEIEEPLLDPAIKKPRALSHRQALAFTHQAGQKILSHLKTPIGKLAAVQVIALAGLFLYVQSLPLSEATDRAQPSPTPSPSPLAYQRYLPAVGQYEAPIPFSETTEALVETALPWHSWVTPWNVAAIEKTNAAYASLSAFWLTLDENGVTVNPKSSWDSWIELRDGLANRQETTLYATITGHPNDSYKVLSNASVQEAHIAELLRIVEEEGFDGIDIDYEGLGDANRELFTGFIRNLTEAFHQHDKKVAVTLEARLANAVPMDWEALGGIADEIRIMAYDYHAQVTGTPGPIAPIGWLKEILDYATKNIPHQKLIVGLGNYGYDWTLNEENGAWEGVGISFDQALARSNAAQTPVLRANGIDARGYDVGSIPYFSYRDEDGKTREVWFEDQESLNAKISLIKTYQTAGIIFWSVGLGDKSFWHESTEQ